MALSGSSRRSAWVPALVLLLAGTGAAAGWWWESGRRGAANEGELGRQLAAAGIDARQKTAIEGVVRQYILDHPEILPEAMRNLQNKGAAKQIAANRDRIETPFPGAVLGNPRGTVTLVQFTDYACTYCRQSVPDVRALLAAHPEVRVVIRELPILSAESEHAARIALAAARQGRYAQFHEAMFAGDKPSPASIDAAAARAGVDQASAASAAQNPAITSELSTNLALSRELGITGTPSWVIGDRLLVGAVGRQALEQAIAEAKTAA